ncbi:MAG: peptidase M10, partial [Winogradskyella sp.]|nr:peptidase M10 [Winogradskyella sp.]
MKKIVKYLAITLSVSALVFTSCEKDSALEDVSNLNEDVIINMNKLDNRTLVTDIDLL